MAHLPPHGEGGHIYHPMGRVGTFTTPWGGWAEWEREGTAADTNWDRRVISYGLWTMSRVTRATEAIPSDASSRSEDSQMFGLLPEILSAQFILLQTFGIPAPTCRRGIQVIADWTLKTNYTSICL